MKIIRPWLKIIVHTIIRV